MKSISTLAVAAVAAIALGLIGGKSVLAAGAGPCAGHSMPSEAQISQLHADLHLTAPQESAWQGLMAMMRSMQQPHAPMANMAQLTTPQRLDLMMQQMQTHEREMTAHLDAMKNFYAQLNPAQRQIFDRETLAVHSGM